MADLTRRNLLAAAGGWSIVPRHVLGGTGYVPPSSRINIAFIGVGSQGLRVMLQFLAQPDVQAVAVCDANRRSNDYPQWGKHEFRDIVSRLLGSTPPWVEWLSTNRPIRLTPLSVTYGGVAGWEPCQRIVNAYYGKAKRSGDWNGCNAYTDFRELLEKEDCDAVVVGTPDHWHAHISIAAMRKGKHVFCQKPMTHSVAEARKMAEVARQTGAVTQVAVGNQATEDSRLVREWIAAGVIGKVRRVVNWSTRPVWPQAIERPAGKPPVPEGLDWDLWVGPSPMRPYHPAYLPFVWRGWYDFGTGAIGDMGCYSFDTIFRALALDAPETVEASSTYPYEETYPAAGVIHFRFPARNGLPPVLVSWYDGRLKPPRPPEMEPERKLAREGLMFLGDEGTLLCRFHGMKPRLVPEAKMKRFTPPPKTLPRSPGNEREWLDAIHDRSKTTGANFEFEAKITETILLGNVAQRAGGLIRWDPRAMRALNVDAGKLLQPPYREGWEL